MTIRLNGSTSGYTEIDAPAVAGSNTLLLPTGNGSANQFVKNGSTPGSLAWSSATEDSSGNFAFNSGYGSVAPVYGCRAWVNFDGTTAGTFAGGASTVTRTAGSTTATITTTTAHNLTTGNSVYAATGVVAGSYTVTVLTSTTFTITTAATTALSAASITFNFATIRGSGNINSVAKNGTGNYTVNFSTPMPDTNFAIVGGVGAQSYAATPEFGYTKTVSSFLLATIMVQGISGDNRSSGDNANIHVAIFR